jgi:hypothetical protein
LAALAYLSGLGFPAQPRSAANIPIKDADLEKLSGDALDRNTVRNTLKDVDWLSSRLALLIA